ncbi:hypothetical protein MTBBW1_1920006 [Desulfamplus magnetovallimortis]|uniref:Uncharacterized protein n=1 Tax=Desulfamplus magnetovallimortis TaxID=1246637 RepID=A0A1W1HB42_9BACT|nr:hypothetical protein [Desulfamplus magnetovallimortis]SLM29659.1 hypothetical protein MTBBW1_1920006 [Desulfamplus magnetovallimortis]
MIKYEKNMVKESGIPLKDIQGAGKLTIDAIVGITDIVDSMHHTITSFGGIMGGENQTRTGGITGIAYSGVRTITEAVGKCLDSALNKLSIMIEDRDTLFTGESDSSCTGESNSSCTGESAFSCTGEGDSSYNESKKTCFIKKTISLQIVKLCFPH